MENQLNKAQHAAVTLPAGHLLVLAGAGSGKTRVLTQRIAWLLQNLQTSLQSILAVTFTNKAAREMKTRVEALLGRSTQFMWIGTFHSLSHRLLRLHFQAAHLPQQFQILDAEDQYRLIRRILKEHNVDETRYPPKQLQWYINSQKDEGLRARDVIRNDDFYTEKMIGLYEAYERVCQQSGLVDFSEILLRTYELLKNNAELLAHYQERFKYILVDEFQDTNALQYALIKLLAGTEAQVMVVGDDDQSIYGWRGARIENIQQFSKDFPQATLVKLEQNYRSTATILNAANALIAQNDGRMGKELWTDGHEGELISLYAAFNDADEARFVVLEIKSLRDRGRLLKDIGILYRSNAQSRILEETLMYESIPYRVYGGLRFYDRAEIKDTLAYLRLMNNPQDDSSFERIVNTPTRGLGDKTLESIRELARTQQITLWEAANAIVAQLPARASLALTAFLNLMNSFKTECATFTLSACVEHVVRYSGLVEHYQKEKGEKGQSRLENLSELVNSTRSFTPDEQDESPVLSQFLSYVALESGETQADEVTDCVQLMTLHSAKGLEFPVVFMCGVEEGLFPHGMSVNEPLRMEEERRLCYVGITRAMEKLYLTYSELRRLYGQEQFHRPSRFIKEIPPELLDEVKFKTTVSRPLSVREPVDTSYPFKLGQSVYHEKFGEGAVLNYEGAGEHLRVSVKFKKVGVKCLALQYAMLAAL